MLLFLRQMTYYLINLSLDLPLSYILTSYSANIVIFLISAKDYVIKFELIYIIYNYYRYISLFLIRIITFSSRYHTI